MQRQRLARTALAAACLWAFGMAACTRQESAREAEARAPGVDAPAAAEPGSELGAPLGAENESPVRPAAQAPSAPAEPEARPAATAASPPESQISGGAPAATAPSSEAQSEGQPAPVDLEELSQHLKETPAIGLFTKLELKSQIDELVEKARASHTRGVPPLETVHERFDLLVLKLLSLLQDDAPALAAEVAASRESLWGVLADPVQLSRL